MISNQEGIDWFPISLSYIVIDSQAAERKEGNQWESVWKLQQYSLGPVRSEQDIEQKQAIFSKNNDILDQNMPQNTTQITTCILNELCRTRCKKSGNPGNIVDLRFSSL